MKQSIIFICLCLSSLLYAQGDFPKVTINSNLSYRMLEQNQNLRKVSILLNSKSNHQNQETSLVLGTSLVALANIQRSNTDSKFGYLMRHPTANNQIGKTVSEVVIHSFQVSSIANVNSWITAYAELLYNPEQSFGQGTITSLERNQLQLRRGFVLLGNPDKSPFYGALGKMDAPFGLTGSVNPFTNSSMWHAFGGLGYGAQIGYRDQIFHATFMAVQGGAQFRAMNTPVRDSTNVPSQLNNFVLDVNVRPTVDRFNLMIGASFLRGSAYCQGFPVTHFEPCSEVNPAYTVYAQAQLESNLLLMFSFAQTLNEWPGTSNPMPPLDVFEASKVSSLSLGGKYLVIDRDAYSSSASFEFSNFRAGPNDAPWERQNQFILGIDLQFRQSSKFFLEIFRTAGYTPLNFISGSDPFAPFPPGETHSENDARSTGIVVGGQITL